MTDLLRPELLELLRQIDTPTLSNAIEGFKVRDRTEGYLGSEIRCLFPDLGTMLGYAFTLEADSTTPGAVPARDGGSLAWSSHQPDPRPFDAAGRAAETNPRLRKGQQRPPGPGRASAR